MTVALIVVTAGLWTLCLAGIVWNGMSASKRRLDHGEAAGAVHGRPGRHHRLKGHTVGFAWSDEMSFSELKREAAAGSKRSARGTQFLLVVIGGVGGVASLALLIGWLNRPTGLVFAVLLVAYVAVQMTRGLRRA